MAALRRQQGGAAATAAAGGADAAEPEASGSSWDTPAARELRAKIRSLEREARKREAVLQASGQDRLARQKTSQRNAFARALFAVRCR